MRGAGLFAWSVPGNSEQYCALKRKATLTCYFGEPRGNNKLTVKPISGGSHAFEIKERK